MCITLFRSTSSSKSSSGMWTMGVKWVRGQQRQQSSSLKWKLVTKQSLLKIQPNKRDSKLRALTQLLCHLLRLLRGRNYSKVRVIHQLPILFMNVQPMHNLSFKRKFSFHLLYTPVKKQSNHQKQKTFRQQCIFLRYSTTMYFCMQQPLTKTS